MIARRAVLRGACAFAGLYGCGRPPAGVGDNGCHSRPVGDTGTDADTDTAPDTGACADDAEPGGEGWVAIDLREHPGLEAPGGHAYVAVPDALLQVTILHLPDGCFTAVWRICTHGACETEWVPEAALLECPCHGSQFDTDGAILQGPATVPLRTFQTVRRGDTLWVYRPT